MASAARLSSLPTSNSNRWLIAQVSHWSSNSIRVRWVLIELSSRQEKRAARITLVAALALRHSTKPRTTLVAQTIVVCSKRPRPPRALNSYSSRRLQHLQLWTSIAPQTMSLWIISHLQSWILQIGHLHDKLIRRRRPDFRPLRWLKQWRFRTNWRVPYSIKTTIPTHHCS